MSTKLDQIIHVFTYRKMRIIVHVKPNAKEFRVEKITESEWIVYVRSPPKKGLANEELVKELKRLLRRNVRIVSGYTSRTKVIEISRFT